jgi:hypothetical protein
MSRPKVRYMYELYSPDLIAETYTRMYNTFEEAKEEFNKDIGKYKQSKQTIWEVVDVTPKLHKVLTEE